MGHSFFQGLPKGYATMDALDFHPYQPGDDFELLQCMQECFGFEWERKTLNHLYWGNPVGNPIVCLAYHHTTIVGQTAFLPRQIRGWQVSGLAGHSIFGMIRQPYRKKGLRSILVNQAHQFVQEQDFLISYTFANDLASVGNQRKYGYHHVRGLPVMIRPLNPILGIMALGRQFRRNTLRKENGFSQAPHDVIDHSAVSPFFQTPGAESPHHDPSGWTTPKFDERHTGLFTHADSLPPIQLVRDANILTWRYPPGPESAYRQFDVLDGQRLLATVVARVADLMGMRFVFVMEWVWDESALHAGLKAMKATIQWGKCIGAMGITALAMPQTLQRGRLAKFGFLGIPDAFLPGNITLQVRKEKGSVRSGEWTKPSNWHLTWGDGFLL